MDIKAELELSKDKRKEVIIKITHNQQEHQQLLQEALRLDGEIRLLQRIAKEDGG